MTFSQAVRWFGEYAVDLHTAQEETGTSSLRYAEAKEQYHAGLKRLQDIHNKKCLGSKAMGYSEGYRDAKEKHKVKS